MTDSDQPSICAHLPCRRRACSSCGFARLKREPGLGYANRHGTIAESVQYITSMAMERTPPAKVHEIARLPLVAY
jgi:hypothetical protein